MAYRVKSYLFAFALSLIGASSGLAQVGLPLPHVEPGRFNPHTRHYAGAVAMTNQQLADSVAARLRMSTYLAGYRIDVMCQNGVVHLDGYVSSPQQIAHAEQIVRSQPGVTFVANRLRATETNHLRQAQILQPPPPVEGSAGKPDAGQAQPPAPKQFEEPGAIFRAAPTPRPGAYNPPRMPPYAWPTYAPYNNYSRVAYPTIYPYKSWPFIGPFNPFPKVPLGWRSVTLTWRDGFWWYGRNATGHDWWQVRFW